MNWVNLKVATLRNPAYIGCEPITRATWLNVLTYCTEQENGGKIVGAKKWKDRQWQQTCGVMLSEVESSDPLLTWEGDDLIVWSYPVDKQEEVSEKRANAKLNGTKGGRPKKPTPETNEKPTGNQRGLSSENQRPKAEGERKEKENRNWKENGTTPLPPSATAGVVEGEARKLIPTTDQSKRIAKIFHRKLTTTWSDDEYKSYRKIGTPSEEDIAAVETYYSENWPPTTGVNILRHDLQTFLNNFTGEVDRARNYLSESEQKRNALFSS